MTAQAKVLYEAVMELPPEERWRLVEDLIDSVPPVPTPPLSAAWRAELERRSAEIESGTVKLIPMSEVRERVRRTLDEIRERG